MLLRAKLSQVFFLAVVSILLVLLAVIYLYSVPLINEKVYETERHSSRLVLNNVYDLANKMNLSLMTYQRETLANHKRNMKSVIDLAETYVESSLQAGKASGQSQAVVLKQIYSGLRAFSYGNDNYIWVADQSYTILSHPDPRYFGLDASKLRDASGNLVIPTVIGKARVQGEGFYQYPWHRLGQDQDVDKISYVKYFPQWDLFIGTGMYIDDIEKEIDIRRTEVIKDLRQAIEDIVIADTGYLFIFDEQGNMLVHPNDNIEATNAFSLNNPLTGQSILQELMGVADTGKELIYQWDRPTDPNNYVYDKLSLVRHLAGLGWYLCSSVYIEELQSSGKLLSQRILMIAALALFAAILLALLFANWVTQPITQLANVAKKVSHGDLTLTSGIDRKDEFGVLGAAFDHMVTQLRDNIASLDQKVASRTEALVATNQQLQRTMLESERVQQQLMQAQRMNAVGQLAGGLAHDFNNLLTIILGNLLSAKQQFTSNAILLKQLEPAIRATRRGSDITNRLLAFSRRQSLQPSRINITDLISETVELIKGSLPSTITISSHFDDNKLQTHVDPSQLDNCMINLLLNAKDAMPNGGDIDIHVSEIQVSKPLEFDEQVPLGAYVKVVVMDTGHGFSLDAMNMAFEPFYTTKTAGQGSGLGLSMVFGFIKQSRGYIHLSNVPYGGAKIVLLLPKLAYQAMPKLTENKAQQDNNTDYKGKLILLVEDDFDVRGIVREQLIAFGFNVIEAVDSDEAEQLIPSIPNLFGMLSDISMPGKKSGFELAQVLRKLDPNCKIVLMSGYVFEHKKASDQAFDEVFLRKPFTASELRYALDCAVTNTAVFNSKNKKENV